MTNESLVKALARLLNDSNFVLSELSDSDDTISMCVRDTLSELRELLPDAIEQFDVWQKY
jgi:hypothetical protein